MKKVLFVLMALCFVSSLAFAAEPVATTAATDPTAAITTETTAADTATVATDTAVTTPEAIVLKGDVIDNMCADANKDNLTEFVKTHSKDCAISCMNSGYSIFADGKLYAFDKDSNAKVGEFLKQADSKLQVIITAKQVGDELSLVSIENQN